MIPNKKIRLPTRSRKYGVGKTIGGAVYVHRRYADVFGAVVSSLAQRLPAEFEYTIVKYVPATGAVTFIECADFDTVPEPTLGRTCQVKPDGAVLLRQAPSDPYIYHHKWLFVVEDYDAFDVAESRRRSAFWMRMENVDFARIGRRTYWAEHIVPFMSVEIQETTNTDEQRDRIDDIEKARHALMDYLSKDKIISFYLGGKGKEIRRGKVVSPESSAAIAANVFGLFIDHSELLYVPTALDLGSATNVKLEAELRFPWSGGYHPWLDVIIETPNEIVGIESKRYEPFRDRHKVEFSSAFDRPVWGEQMSAFHLMRQALLDGLLAYRFLDAAQLVKHAYGLRTQAARQNKSAKLVYVYAEPGARADGKVILRDQIEQHRKEVASFAQAVADNSCDVQFYYVSYQKLLGDWSMSASDNLRSHATSVLSRFDL